MKDKNKLKDIISECFAVDPKSITDDFLIPSGSLTRARLYSRLKSEINYDSQIIFTVNTYNDLFKDFNNIYEIKKQDNSTEKLYEDYSSDNENIIQCGIDIQHTHELPKVEDYWEDNFYNDHFTRREIAHCIMQNETILHFAARWAAKEALKKCDSFFINKSMKCLEIISENNKKPKLLYIENSLHIELTHSLSISHSKDIAVAVVVR